MKAATPDKPLRLTLYLISIHAAREGGDASNFFLTSLRAISIHAAREGGDAAAQFAYAPLEQFQSTPPVKAATQSR